MAGCPLRNFENCPEHNKNGGCAWWLSYSKNSEAPIEACAITLSPILQLEQTNALGAVARGVQEVGAEVSAGRVEHIKEATASRLQLLTLAQGQKAYVEADHSRTQKMQTQKMQLGETK